jgi:Icc-related predicted phosphoesterase
MKIALCSDLHLEFADIDLKNTEDADVLILSGDICVARELPFTDSDRGEKFRQFFKRCSLEFSHVIYIMGNHEHYRGDFQTSANIIRNTVSGYNNFYFLDKETKVIDNVTFIGGTLWTDMNKEDPITIWDVCRAMNDFRVIDNSIRTMGLSDVPARFSPEDAVEDHKLMLDYIRKNIPTDGKCVVVGHHSPSKQSIKPKYQGDYHMNGGYSSDLESFILDHPQINLWTHGHTHDKFDYMVGSTRILCNPRGYKGYEEVADNFQLVYVEV